MIDICISSWIMQNKAIWFPEASQNTKNCNAESKLATSRVSTNNNFIYVHTKVLLGLCQYPIISLIGVINRNREWMLWCQSVINAENWNFELTSPSSQIYFMVRSVLTNKSSSMEMDDDFINFCSKWTEFLSGYVLNFLNILLQSLLPLNSRLFLLELKVCFHIKQKLYSNLFLWIKLLLVCVKSLLSCWF